MGWTVWSKIFCTCPDWLWGPPSLLYNGFLVSFPGVKWPGRGIDHRPSSSAEVKERVDLHLYYPSGPSQPVLGWNLPYHFQLTPSSTVVSIVCSLTLKKTSFSVRLYYSFSYDSYSYNGCSPTYLLTYLLTPWSRVLLEKLAGLQLVVLVSIINWLAFIIEIQSIYCVIGI